MLLLLTFICGALSAACGEKQYWNQETSECVQCTHPCVECYSANKCTKCDDTTTDIDGKQVPQYVLDSTYKCVTFEKIDNCATYDGINCVECADGFYLQGNACHSCDLMGVEKCSKCNMKKCFKCTGTLTLYEGDGKQTCIDCSEPVNDEKCGRCPLGKYFNTSLLNCQPCRQGCDRCTTVDNCYLCSGDFALEDPSDPMSVCKEIENCEPGHYYGNHCELCKNEYFVLDGKCEKCGDDCNRCVNKTHCVECVQGAQLSNGACTKIENCRRSSDLIGCLECDSGYYLKTKDGSTEKECVKCHDSCATCKTYDVCFTCAANYFFTDKANGKCRPMDTDTCDVADQYGCLHCKSEVKYTTWSGFTAEDDKYKVDDIKKLIQDTANEELKETLTDDNITKVDIGFFLPYEYNETIEKVIYKQECEMCNPACKICEHNADWCTACNDGYQMTENATATALYKKHFKIEGNDTKIYNCKKLHETCKSTTMGYCTECNNPYFLSELNCIQCDDSCASCTDEYNCQTCATPKSGESVKYWRPKAYNDFEDATEKGPCWNVTDTDKLSKYFIDCKDDSMTITGCSDCVEGKYKNDRWGGCKKCPSECVGCKLKDSNFESDEEEYLQDNTQAPGFLDHFTCTSCKPASGGYAGQILKDGRCHECSTIKNCIECSGTNEFCVKCATNYEKSNNGASCEISNLVIILPIASVAVVFVIIIIIIVVIIIWQKRKKTLRERENAIRPFKVSNEVEMALLSADNENFPLKTSTWTLDFDNKGTKVLIDQEYKQVVTINNPTKKSYFFEVLAGASHRYELSVEPMRFTLKPGMAVEATFTIKMLCTAIVKDEIGIVAMDMDEDSKETAKITIMVESDMSMKLDHTELKLQMPAIGEGAFGMVFVGTYRGQKVAVKKMKARNLTEEQEKEFKHEVNMLTQYRHSCIVNLVGAVYTEGEISIVTEFAEYGSLSKLWGKEKISYDLKIKLMEDSVVALSFLHESQIIHRDVKGENVLVYSLNPHSPVCGKLTDFGTCRNISERSLQTKALSTGIGTPTYMAPECLANANYTFSADVYSFAVVLYETYTEKTAYLDDPKFNQPWMIPQFVIEGKRLEKPSGVPEDYWGLIDLCWQQEADKRPTFPQVYATLAQMNVDITHTEMNTKAEAVPVGGQGAADAGEIEEGSSSSSSSSSSSEE